jgi:hypothetical protein
MISVHETEKLSLQQIEMFLVAANEVRFEQVDEAHEGLSGPATRRILEREFREYGKAELERWAGISNGHLYNLRRQPGLSSATPELPEDTAQHRAHWRAS